MYQHAILPRLLWPLLIYEVPITTVDKMERNISGFLRRWLGLPKSLSSAALYGTTNAVQLPFSGLKEEFIVTRTREAMLYNESNDPKVVAARVEIRTGRKWKATKELQVAEERLKQKAMVGVVAKGTAGLGYFPTTQVSQAKGKDRRRLIQEEVRKGVEEDRLCKMVGLAQQGAWTKWEDTIQRKISWTDIWQFNFSRVGFLVQTVYDTLPSPANLHTWGKIESPACQLCTKNGTLQHILSSCPKALNRYRWRHDQVLKVIADEVSAIIKTSKYQPDKRVRLINFIKPGEKKQAQRKETPSLLTSAPDWQIRVDLGKQLKFPEHIIETSLRPDMVLFSNATKQLIIWELTIAWEENMATSNERKRSKYQELKEQCQANGWRTFLDPIEVGCRGFAGKSLCKAFSKIGIVGVRKRKAIKNIIESAEKSSRWVWMKRADTWDSAK